MSTYEPIASQTLGSAASEIVFSSLPQNYTDLILVGSVIRTASSDTRIQVNGDTSSLYSYTFLGGNGSSASSFRVSNAIQWDVGYQPATTPTTLISNFQNYSNGATFKTVLSRASASAGDVAAFASLYRSTSPITSIRIFQTSGNLASGSTFTIYGVAAGNSSAKATGGNIVTTDGSYWYHAFTSSGTFIPNSALSADVLVVAGGGSGGSETNSGGGGAGGLLAFTSQSLSSNTVYPCLIGAGAAGVYQLDGRNGNDSQFGSLTLVKGGGGGGGAYTTSARNGLTGGSGGGGGRSNTGTGTGTGGSPTTSQGFAGGTANSGAIGGGGGGSAEAGNTDSTGFGGDGLSTYSSWGLATGTGQNVSGTVYFAGGGGGSIYPSGTIDGGLGGGGAGGQYTTVDGGKGLPNTGGGGGGGANTTNVSGAGGSGIIIVRYAV
jgi:hypothetical protein